LRQGLEPGLRKPPNEALTPGRRGTWEKPGDWQSVANDLLIQQVPDGATFWKIVGTFQKVETKQGIRPTKSGTTYKRAEENGRKGIGQTK
jgi:hypothetical protein